MAKNATTDGERARLNCRVDARIKNQAEDAARLLGQSITDFTESALAEKAQAVFESLERLELSADNFDRFVQAITQPAAPTATLTAAAEDYNRLRIELPDSNW